MLEKGFLSVSVTFWIFVCASDQTEFVFVLSLRVLAFQRQIVDAVEDSSLSLDPSHDTVTIFPRVPPCFLWLAEYSSWMARANPR